MTKPTRRLPITAITRKERKRRYFRAARYVEKALAELGGMSVLFAPQDPQLGYRYNGIIMSLTATRQKMQRLWELSGRRWPEHLETYL